MSYHVDWPSAEFHEILPNLYLGGHLWSDNGSARDARHSSVGSDPSWDYVVSAHVDRDRDAKCSFPICDTRFVLFEDTRDKLDDETWVLIKLAVDEVVARWRRGQKVLVRCQAGYNRSGLLMALILMRLGMSADRAIHQARWRRGRDVLTNWVFEGYVREREDEYHEPAAWAATEMLMNTPTSAKVVAADSPDTGGSDELVRHDDGGSA